MENLNVQSRVKNVNHEAKKCRRKGMVPGIIYGKGIQNLLFEIGELELNSVLHKEGEHGLLNVQCDGASMDALIKEVQRDPVTRRVIHVDLEKVERDKKITTSIPIHYIGEDLVNRSGNILQKDKDSIRIQCEANEIPKFINLDVTGAEVGHQFRISDVEFASDIAILDDLNTVLASISKEQKLPENFEMENGIVENKSVNGK